MSNLMWCSRSREGWKIFAAELPVQLNRATGGGVQARCKRLVTCLKASGIESYKYWVDSPRLMTDKLAEVGEGRLTWEEAYQEQPLVRAGGMAIPLGD